MQWIHNNYYWVVYVYVSVVWCSAVFLFCVRFARRQTRDRRHIESIKIGDIMQFENGEKISCLQSALHESYSCTRIESALLAVCRRLHCWSNLIPKTQFLENRTKNWDAECTHSLIHPFHVNYLSLCVHCACAYCRVSTVDCRPEMNTLQMLLRLLFWIMLFFYRIAFRYMRNFL